MGLEVKAICDKCGKEIEFPKDLDELKSELEYVLKYLTSRHFDSILCHGCETKWKRFLEAERITDKVIFSRFINEQSRPTI